MAYKNYKKLTKKQARKLYDEGKEIFFHTSLLSWNNPWQNPMPVKKNFDDEKSRKELYQLRMDKNLHTVLGEKPTPYIEQFDIHVNEYSYYNCDKERGRRVIYLVESK